MRTRRHILRLTATLTAATVSQFLLQACTSASNTGAPPTQPSAPAPVLTGAPTIVPPTAPAAPTAVPAGVTTARPAAAAATSSSGGLKLPTYVPIAGVKPDLPGDDVI